MQNIEQLARDLGAALQLCPEYVRMVAAKERNEADEALQEKMQALGLVRMQYQREAAKGEGRDEVPDKARMNEYETRFQAIYDEIMANANMAEYQAAAKELDDLVKFVTGIISGCAQGEDPASFEPKDAGCGGDCGGCSGCGYSGI